MPMLLRAAAVAFMGAFLWAASASASAGGVGELPQQREGAAAAPALDGKEVLTRKCFQCHQASMWSSLKGDRKAWESVLYRMVGRGALWTEAEINAMADFLAQSRGQK
jgi:cytochrome c5